MIVPRTVRIIGTGMTKLGKLGVPASKLMQVALEKALAASGLRLRQIDGLIAVPSLSDPHFMEAHYFATQMGLLPQKNLRMRTIDTGGAGPVTALLEAYRMIKNEHCEVVAVVAGDSVSSLNTEDFLKRADQGCRDPDGALPSPVIPHGYDRIAAWQMETYGVTREQLAMASVLMSRQAIRHPYAMTKSVRTLQEILESKKIASVTNLLECARRADGGAAFIVASSSFMRRNGYFNGNRGVVILGGGEASGPLYPPKVIDEEMFSCEEAANYAYVESQIYCDDIDWFGLYDCFPVCLIRAVEAVGLASKGKGGEWIERKYHTYNETSLPTDFPVNTHGGLLAFGAPWETPAMYNIIEAVDQLINKAGNRQIPNARRALVYGNGGIFSHSSVAILAKPVD